jgi:hypothetical protein
MIEMEVDTSKGLFTLTVSEILFDVRQNICTKQLGIAPDPARQSKKTLDTEHRPDNGKHVCLLDFSVLFEPEELLSRSANRITGTRNRNVAHRQLINVRSLSFGMAQ